METDDVAWLGEAVDLAVESVAGGGGPFGAVLVRDKVVVTTGQNRVTLDHDPTAHAEMVAIRRGCAELGEFSLAGCTLYASCEPCPMCAAALLWARVDRVVHAADRYDAARAGFDDREFHDLVMQDRTTWPSPVVRLLVPDPDAPFRAWSQHPERTPY